MAVYLRKKKLSGGSQSYYLDIWYDDKRHYEFLKLYLTRARNPIKKKQSGYQGNYDKIAFYMSLSEAGKMKNPANIEIYRVFV